jgi:hypothetical protein
MEDTKIYLSKSPKYWGENVIEWIKSLRIHKPQISDLLL